MINADTAVQYHYKKFPPNTIDYQSLVEPIIKATGAISRYDQMLKNLHNSEIFLAPLINQEAVTSSRMEGTISTMDEILQYEADYTSKDDSLINLRSEIIETYLYQKALKTAQQSIKYGQKISSSLIKSAHQELLSFGRGAHKSPGEFRKEQNFIVDRSRQEILFTPISPEHLNAGIDNLFDYIENSDETALLKSAITHVEFEALHPFKDGNGRIGRMLITLMLWKSKTISAPHFYLSNFFEKNKDQYIDLMRNVSAKGDWHSWFLFYLEAIEKQAINNLEIAEEIRSLYENMKKTFSSILSSKYSLDALDFVFTNPIFRNNKFTSSAGIPVPTASRIARALLEHDIIKLKDHASGSKAALYSFEPLMKIIRV